MTPLGNPLVFYLKYMAEMNRLYDHDGGEKPDLTGLVDKDQAWDMVRTVGAVAYEQSTDFLELCGKEIENHFGRLKGATLTNKSRRASIVYKWEWGARVHLAAVPGSWFSCGVWITAPPEIRAPLEENACGVVVPWIWSRGGRKGADAVWRVVGDWADSRAGEGLVEENGTVALGRIPIKALPPESFDVDRDELLAGVKNIIARLGIEQTRAIENAVAGLNETDES